MGMTEAVRGTFQAVRPSGVCGPWFFFSVSYEIHKKRRFHCVFLISNINISFRTNVARSFDDFECIFLKE